MAGSASSDYITEQEAKELALKNAGLAEEEVQFRKAAFGLRRQSRTVRY